MTVCRGMRGFSACGDFDGARVASGEDFLICLCKWLNIDPLSFSFRGCCSAPPRLFVYANDREGKQGMSGCKIRKGKLIDCLHHRSSGISDFRRVNTNVGRKIFAPDVVFRIFVSATKEIQFQKWNQLMSNLSDPNLWKTTDNPNPFKTVSICWTLKKNIFTAQGAGRFFLLLFTKLFSIFNVRDQKGETCVGRKAYSRGKRSVRLGMREGLTRGDGWPWRT
jgi:hypothetical protein